MNTKHLTPKEFIDWAISKKKGADSVRSLRLLNGMIGHARRKGFITSRQFQKYQEARR